MIGGGDVGLLKSAAAARKARNRLKPVCHFVESFTDRRFGAAPTRDDRGGESRMVSFRNEARPGRWRR